MNIVFMNQKGGVGKTTCCCELGKSLERTGTPYSFFNLDPQGGSLIEPKDDPNAEVTIVDTPGVLSEHSAEWVQNADVICVPTRASALDIPTLNRMLDMVQTYRKKDAALVIIINQWTRWTSCKDFMVWLGGLDWLNAVVTTLPQSEMFLQASAMGKSVIEFAPRHMAAQGALDMVNTIRKVAGLDEELLEAYRGKKPDGTDFD